MKYTRMNDLNALVPILLLVVFIVVISFYIPKEIIERFVVRAGIFAPFAFILAALLTLVFAPLSGTPVMAAGFYLFGNKIAVYSFISLVIAMVINFWISRIWGIKIVTKLAGKGNLKKLDSFSKEHGLITLFIMRFFLHGFEDLISYAAGLTSMKFKPYLITSILAVLPWSIFWYSYSNRLNTVQFTIAVVSLSAVFIIPYTIWEKYIHKQQK